MKFRFENYQQFPTPFIAGSIFSRIQEMLSFVRHFPSNFLYRQSNKDSLNLLKKHRNKYKSVDLLLIGNGPSSRNVTADQVTFFQKKGGHVAVVNDFFKSELSRTITPFYYFLTDPHYWRTDQEIDGELNHSLMETKSDFSQFLSRNPNMTIVQPLRQPKISRYHQQYLFTDCYKLQGVGNFSNPIKFWSYPNSIALTAIAVAKFLGYRNIFFSGLDFSHFLNFVVDDFNSILFNPSNAHFYSSQNSCKESTHISLAGTPIRHYGDVHFAAAVHRRDFLRLVDERCINVGLDFTNDTCFRGCLIRLPKNSGLFK